MVTIITHNNCFMFNMKNYEQEIELCCFLQRLRKRKKDKFKAVSISVKETKYSKTKVYKLQPSNVEKIIYEERYYNINDGFYINQLIKNTTNI